MTILALLGGFALYLGIPFMLEMVWRESGSLRKGDRPWAKAGLSGGPCQQGTASHSPSPFLDAVWAKHCEQRAIREQEHAAALGRVNHQRLLADLFLQPFRITGLPSNVCEFALFSPCERQAICEADANRLLPEDSE